VRAEGAEVLRLAVVGCGGRGSGAADQALSVGGVKLVAMADAFENRLQSSLQNLQSRHQGMVDVPPDRQFVGFEGYKQAIGLADVVILAAPPGFRPMHFEEAVRQGRHIFAEKPMAVDGPGVRRVLGAVEESKRKGLKVVVGLQRRYQPGYVETVHRLQEGAIGEVQVAHCYWNDGGVWVNPRQAGESEMHFQMRNWYYFNWLCGDHIVEQHIHNLDVINWVERDTYPVKCHGMGGRQVRTGKEYGEIFDHHAVEYEYVDGTKLFSQCRHIRGCWNSVSEHVIGTRGSAGINSHVIYEADRKVQWRYQSGEQVNPYQREHDDLIAAIRNGTSLNDGENGVLSTLTAIMGRMATYSGQVVTWDEALNSEVDLMPEKLAWDAPPRVLPDRDGFYPVAMPGTIVSV
jgi:myo-inositol 2-dehydrogenase / D-chiro-inositol 1-dehydrogenase